MIGVGPVGEKGPFVREFSFLAVVPGIVIGAVPAAANAFVGLKVGMTISASIPARLLAEPRATPILLSKRSLIRV